MLRVRKKMTNALLVALVFVSASSKAPQAATSHPNALLRVKTSVADSDSSKTLLEIRDNGAVLYFSNDAFGKAQVTPVAVLSPTLTSNLKEMIGYIDTGKELIDATPSAPTCIGEPVITVVTVKGSLESVIRRNVGCHALSNPSKIATHFAELAETFLTLATQ